MQVTPVIIDHRDSFTYNIVELIRRISGRSPVVIPYSNIHRYSPEDFSHIILSPGPGHPEEYPESIHWWEAAGGEKPLLGICLGHQLIARRFGSPLYRMPTPVHGVPVPVKHTGKSRLYRNIPETFTAGLYHSWAVDRKAFPEVLRITSSGLTGNIIMSLEHRNLPAFGLQYHPESFMTTHGETLIRNFLSIRSKP